MISVCSYCRRTMGIKEPRADNSISHGICPDCDLDSIGTLLGVAIKLALNPALPEKPSQPWRGA